MQVAPPAQRAALLQRARGAAEQAAQCLPPMHSWMPRLLRQSLEGMQRRVEEQLQAAASGRYTQVVSQQAREAPTFWQAHKAAPRCSFCGDVPPHARRCGRCRVAVYCSKDCQLKHWRAGHRSECARLATAAGQE
ncbi:hypothetical protein ABPG75_002772 [Micractinium tetrahymenae]